MKIRVKDFEIKEENYGKKKGEPVRWDLSYQPAVFSIAVKKKIGGNYPIGGEVIAKVDKELLDAIRKYYNPKTKIKIGDEIVMNNGWTLD